MTEHSRRSRPTEITDAPEHRAIPIDQVELRATDGADEATLTGYASTFEPYEMYGGPAAGGWIEQLDRRAFDKTLHEKPDLMLLINHEGMPLARTKSGTLQLSVDARGLKVTAKLDRSDPDVQRLERKMARRDMDEMSFAFRVKAQKWDSTPEFKDDPQALRSITEVSLHKGDVSVVNYGANPTTSAEMKKAMRAFAKRASEMSKRADGDDDPSALLAALDATLDEACNLVAGIDRAGLPPEVGQALDLVVAAESIVDELMELMGVYDPDDDEADEPRSRPNAEPVKKKTLSVREALVRQGLADKDGGTLSVTDALAQIGEAA